MYQCLGLGTVNEGGCNEDWWHAHCLMGLPKDWPENPTQQKPRPKRPDSEADEDNHPVPEGFPEDDDFTTVICYKCVESNPWIKRYASTKGFLPPLYKGEHDKSDQGAVEPVATVSSTQSSMKRKASADDEDLERPASPVKRLKEEERSSEQPNGQVSITPSTVTKAKHENLPPAPSGTFSLLAQKDFREEFCRCPECFPHLGSHSQLLEEEDEYEPSLSDSEQSLVDGSGAHSHGTGSLLERGEAALNNVDRVRAIEGVMVYNHLKDKVKAFLKPFAESGEAVGAEDIKAYFEKLRGDEAAIKEAGQRPMIDGDGDTSGQGGSNKKEQSGY